MMDHLHSRRNGPWLWLSASEVSEATVELAAAVVNPTEGALSFGAQGGFDRWTGEGWQSVGTWLFSLDQWGGFADAAGLGEMVFVPAIAINAPARGIGPIGYFRLRGLTEGWYRVGFHRTDTPQIFGVIKVTTGAPTLVPIENPLRPTLLAVPTIMSTGGPVHLYGLPGNHDGHTTFDDVHNFNEAMAESVTLQQWGSGGWEDVTTLAIGPAAERLSNSEEVEVMLPPLTDSAYRIVRASSSGELARVIWIDGSLPG